MINNKQQTALEWSIGQLKLLELNKNRISEYAYKSRLSYIVNKAKEMAKEQIRKAYCDGEYYKDTKLTTDYYNETYGGGER